MSSKNSSASIFFETRLQKPVLYASCIISFFDKPSTFNKSKKNCPEVFFHDNKDLIITFAIVYILLLKSK